MIDIVGDESQIFFARRNYSETRYLVSYLNWAVERLVIFFTIAQSGYVGYDGTMTLSEIQQEAIALPERQRVDLLRTLLDTLPPAGVDVSDEEVASREREMESGEVESLSHEEFVRRVQAERGKCNP